jgi:hypothetical protein
LVLLAGFVLAVVGARHTTDIELGILGGPLVLVLATARRLWPAFRATRGGFE